MATKNNPGVFDCHASAEDDEPLFTLLARDRMAPYLVKIWAACRAGKMREASEAFGVLGYIVRHSDEADPAKVAEAGQCAEDMIAWRSVNRLTDGF